MGRLLHYFRQMGFALACFSLVNTSVAASTVTLVATIANQPALSPATWNIFRADRSNEWITTLTRHSGTINLPAGQYKAIVELNDLRREARFRVESEQSILVKVAMDSAN